MLHSTRTACSIQLACMVLSSLDSIYGDLLEYQHRDAFVTALLIASRIQAVVSHDQLHAVSECSDHPSTDLATADALVDFILCQVCVETSPSSCVCIRSTVHLAICTMLLSCVSIMSWLQLILDHLLHGSASIQHRPGKSGFVQQQSCCFGRVGKFEGVEELMGLICPDRSQA